MRNKTIFLNRESPVQPHNLSGLRLYEITAPQTLYDFLAKVLNESKLPSQSVGVSKTEMYLVLLFISDAVWIVATVGLCVGACCKTCKKKYLSIIFYGPWLLCSAFINFLDVVSSVHYGLDLIYIQSYTTWLTFIGVTNHQGFASFDELPSSAVVPLLPTTVLVSLLSRFFLIWLFNVICFFSVLFMAIPDMMPRTKSRRLEPDPNDPNSSEARIRNWFQFYGNIEANSTMASGPSSPRLGTDNPSCREVGFACDTYSKKRPLKVQSSLEPYSDPSYAKVPIEGCSGGYTRFQDVDAGIVFLDGNDVNKVSAINGYMPWTYIPPILERSLSRKTDDHFKVVQCTRL